MKIIEKCPRCKKKINKQIDGDTYAYFICPRCQVNVAIPHNLKEIKEVIMTEDKKTITQAKDENVNMILQLLADRGCDRLAISRVLSRAYKKNKI